MAQTFERWMQRVDAAIEVTLGVQLDTADLPDQPFMDWYVDEMTPREAAAKTLRDAGWPMELAE